MHSPTANNDPAPAVTFKGVVKRYGAVPVVDHVSFIIPQGILATLLGPSGCGKTTTLRLIAGLEMATEGAILIGGEDVTHTPVTGRDIAMVFQSYALFPHLNVVENVAFGLRNIGRSAAAAQQAAREALDLVGLSGFERRMISQLSGGQQQRVAVARAIVLRPKVLLLDEPLSNLDAKLRRQVRDDIRALQQRLALTVVYVTHDQQEALAVSDLVIVMSAGTISQIGTPQALYETPANRFVADFIGDANVVPATIETVAEGLATVRLGRLTLPPLPARGRSPGAVELAVRPSSVTIDMPGEAVAALDGIVGRSVYLGDCMEYVVRTELGDLYVVDHRRKRRWETGDEVSLRIAGEGVTVLDA